MYVCNIMKTKAFFYVSIPTRRVWIQVNIQQLLGAANPTNKHGKFKDTIHTKTRKQAFRVRDKSNARD